MRKTRRRYLAAVGATIAIAGCQDGGGPTPAGTPGGADDVPDDGATPTPTEEGTPGVGTPTEEGTPGMGTPTEEGTPGVGTPTEEGTPGVGTPTEEGTPGMGTPTEEGA